jgi:hypothetical protein
MTKAEVAVLNVGYVSFLVTSPAALSASRVGRGKHSDLRPDNL